VHRQKLSVEETSKALPDNALLGDVISTRDAAVKLYVKDLGPQISWKTVFLAEYVRLCHFPLANAMMEVCRPDLYSSILSSSTSQKSSMERRFSTVNSKSEPLKCISETFLLTVIPKDYLCNDADSLRQTRIGNAAVSLSSDT
jgi:hypothetical protein